MSPRTCPFALLAALLAPGCAKKSSELHAPSQSTADLASAGAGEGEGDLETLEGALALREDQLRQAGVAVPARADSERMEPPIGAATQGPADANAPVRDAGPPTSTAVPEQPSAMRPTEPSTKKAEVQRERPGRCETVCELSTTICQLEDQICAMAPRHPDEPRYQAACQRADQDCQLATEACHACT